MALGTPCLLRMHRKIRYSPVAVYPTKSIIYTESQKIALRHLGHLAFRGCTLKVIFTLPCTRQKYNLQGIPKNTVRSRVHLAFRGCMLKHCFPVSVYPTENIIFTDYQIITLRRRVHLAIRGFT